MMPENHDPLDALHSLPEHDLDAWRIERIRRRAHAELAGRDVASRVARLWSNRIEPTIVIAAGSAYVVWAFDAAISLYR